MTAAASKGFPVKKPAQWSLFIRDVFCIVQHLPILKERLGELCLEAKQADHTASHQERRHLFASLGARPGDEQPSVKFGLAILETMLQTMDDAAASAFVKESFGLELVIRDDTPKGTFKRCYDIIELAAQVDDVKSKHGYYLVNENTGFYRIPHHTSMIVVIKDATGKLALQNVVIREAPQQSPVRPKLLKWLTAVVQEACYERRDPYHPGKMAQIGLNMGAHHDRSFGYAVSFTRKSLSSEDRKRQDEELIGGLSLFWALLWNYMPAEIMEEVRDKMQNGAEYPYPTMATAHIERGCGFSFDLDGTIFQFKTAKRCPPEGIVTAGYQSWTHLDPVHIRWGFAFCVGRTVPARSSLPSRHFGGNFVDFHSKVIVEQDSGTLLAFAPGDMHATTLKAGVENYILAFCATQRVFDGLNALDSNQLS
ncbi:hypothetical protein BDZ89DRAFT_1117961 [Hymenopellis radicata]|nr:hypothetical protein BDZ89DRAFT_1117961 [Hymenopellis radicata]